VNAGNGNQGCTLSAPVAGVATCDLLQGSVLAGPVRWRQLRDMTATFTADRSNSNAGGGGNSPQTNSLDGIVLDVTYTAPGFESHTCPGNCPILDATGSNALVELAGTFYAPSARADVLAHNNGLVGFDRGIIARTINISVSASSKQETSPFSLPGRDGTRIVLFEAKDESGHVRLRARVSFNDSPELPGKTSKVLDWVVLR
jgi:hypothetical protein